MKNRYQRKKTSIFRIFLFPLIGIMLVQSMITIGTFVVRRTTKMLEEYSVGMMNRLVENREVILQNEMNQRWASICDKEPLMNDIYAQLLNSERMDPAEFAGSEEAKGRLLEQLFPECLDILQNNSTTGVFVILTEGDMKSAGEYEGFFIRDSDPNTNPANYTDLLLERGSKHLSREWNIPMDTGWTTRFQMDGLGNRDAERYFYEPWRAGAEYTDANVSDLGYWALPFTLEKQRADSYEMITYSLPLRHEGKVYGVLGVEISVRELYDYFPVDELNDAQQSGYMLAVRQGDGYVPLAGKGILSNMVSSGRDMFYLEKTGYENLFRVSDVRLERQGIFAVVCPLKLYSNNVPYENTEWVLLGLDTEDDLFGISRLLYIWIIGAVLIGLMFGVVGIYFVVRHLTRPVLQLMECISRGWTGLSEYRSSNILEIDELYDVVNDLTKQQRESENILLEEKERYRVALESSKDFFFSYNYQDHMLDIVNHPTMSGRWQCDEFESGFINPECIYDLDRDAVKEQLSGGEDKLFLEFRLKWPKDADFAWVALSGNAVYDTDGVRRKLIGSIRDIQEQKEKEAKQLKKNITDGVTGLFVFSVGMEQLEAYRKLQQAGVLIHLSLSRLKEINERNGIVFGDMILEELGGLIREHCQEFTDQTGNRTVSFRLDGDEFVLWLQDGTKEQAGEFTARLLKWIRSDFADDLFHVDVRAGLVCAAEDVSSGKLICMAKLAGSQGSPGTEDTGNFYEDLAEEKRTGLPALMGREINSLDYGEDVSLVSVALNLFGKGADFGAQMLLMVRKIGRFYQAKSVLVSVLHADFKSSYLEYQWRRDKKTVEQSAKKYKTEDSETFFSWLGEEQVRYFSEEDSGKEALRIFLHIEEREQGVVLPMYDNGSYMGSICITGIDAALLEISEEYQNLAELGRVIQSQLNQQQYDIASKAKSEFLSRMSHEIRTPMNGIIGMTAIALQEDQDQERIMDCLQKIQASSDYLLGLINDILDMSKIESGKMKLEPVNFNIHEMIETISELILPQATAKGIDFVREISLSHSWFVADRMRISQVLINLLGNAVKFTPAKGKVILTIREEKNGKEGILVYFAVRDTGVGIAEEDQERVFRSFEQASGRNPAKQQGTGLGLSISSRLVQMMGSSIRLDSEPGEGSTFSFQISLEPGKNKETDVVKEEISFEGCRVLVVEDNEINVEIAKYLLEERGFQVECVFDGAQAVERIQTTAPGTYDLILMDIMMPVMDGLAATRAIRAMEREDCHTIPIIAMSANAFDDDLKKSVECGMNGHLSKPVEVDKLYRTLNEILRGRSRDALHPANFV